MATGGSMKIYLPVKLSNGDELTLVRNKETGKILWWNITKGMFEVCGTPFMRGLKQIVESEG